MSEEQRRIKPLPKRQDQIVQENIESYYTSKASNDGVFDRNRGNDLSQKGDDLKDFSIGLQDHDAAVLYYLENVIKPTVIQNGTKVKVPIMYGNQELWKSVQSDGYIRDTNSKLMTPLIMYSRVSFEKNRELSNKVDGNKAHVYQIFEKKYTKQNNYDRFSLLVNRDPVKEYIATVVPDYVTITYSFVVFTEFVEQINPILEAFNYASDSYWGDLNRFKFRAKIDSFSNFVQFAVGEERGVKSTFNVVLNGYIIPESLNKELSTVKKFYSKAQIAFSLETTTSDTEFASLSKKNLLSSPTSVFEGNSVNISNVTYTTINNFGTLAEDELAWINTNVTKQATTVNGDNVAFANTNVLQPPPGSTLPTINKNNFSFFVNGMYVPSTAVASLTEIGNAVYVVFDTVVLDYTLVPSDEVIGVGKFKDV